MASSTRTVLIVGANRGIGLNLARALASRNWTVTGSVRPQTFSDPTTRELEKAVSQVLEIDFLDEKSIISAVQKYGSGPLDMLINCAGVGPEPDFFPQHSAEDRIEKFKINTVGPFLTSKHFYPNLKKAGGKIINVSSDIGSIGDNKEGECLAYRVSKAAQNQLTVTMANEFKIAGDNIAVLVLYPGYVATRMTNYRHKNDMDECIRGIVEVVEGFEMGQTGTFVDWKNQTLVW